MSRTVTRGSSCNYPYRYWGHKLMLAMLVERKVSLAPSEVEFDEPDEDEIDDEIDLDGGVIFFAPEDDGPSCGCYCRRCLLHDDHGGCTEPWNHRMGTYHDHNDPEGGFFA